jgi:hypothetical protein
MDRLLRDDEAGALLGFKGGATIRRLRAAGILEPVYPTGGRAVRVRESDVLALIRRGAPVAETDHAA